MTDLLRTADTVEIEALRGEFTDAAMTNDHERFASLFTPDGAVRIPDAHLAAVGHEQLRALGRGREDRMELFVQNTHAGSIRIDGDTATGRAYITELIRTRSGESHLTYGIYHDKYQRTSDGWRFAERIYEIRYHDAAALAGSPIERNDAS